MRCEVGWEEGMFGRVAAGVGRPMRCVGARGPFGLSKRSGAAAAGMLHVAMSVCLDAGGGPGWRREGESHCSRHMPSFWPAAHPASSHPPA